MRVEGGGVFSLLVVVVVAHLGGWAVSLVRAPPLLGMLLAGILLNNLPYVGTTLGESLLLVLQISVKLLRDYFLTIQQL